MAAVSSVKINGSIQLQIINHSPRREREKFPDEPAYLLLAYLRSPFGINKDRNRLSDTDCVRELDFAGVGKAGSDDVLCDVTGHIACCPVNFGGVFSAEGAAAVTSSVGEQTVSACQAQTSRHPTLHFQTKNPVKNSFFLKISIFYFHSNKHSQNHNSHTNKYPNRSTH